MEIPKRELGKTGVQVTILGLGGEGILRTFGYDNEANTLINRALDLGITYFESARAYSGSESYYGRALKERRNSIFLTSKSHARDKKGALDHLYQTLLNLRTDHLDLWQVHDVRTEDEIKEIFRPKGAIEAFIEAKDQGLARFIGITGHHDPGVLKKCIDMFDFDTVLLPVNPAEPHYKSFLDIIIPSAKEKGIGLVGMKVYLRGFASKLPRVHSMEPFLHFALSQPISNVVVGCDDIQQLEENVKFTMQFTPMAKKASNALIKNIRPFARQLMYYKPS